MVAWRSAFLVCLAFSLATLVQRGSGDFDDFNLEDAVKETSSVKQPWDHTTTTTTNRPGTTRAPAKPPGSGLDLADALDDQDDGRRKPGIGGRERWNHVTTTTKRPVTTRAPANTLGNDFDLADALDDRNDRDDGRRKPIAGGGGFSDKDLEDIVGVENTNLTRVKVMAGTAAMTTLDLAWWQSLAPLPGWPAPWPWPSSVPSPATSPTSRRSSASAFSRVSTQTT
nr:hypothetical protein [Homo sapiens]